MKLRQSLLLPRCAARPECLVLACTMALASLPASGAGASAAPREQLHLGVVINEVPRPSLHEVLREGNTFYMREESLRELGLRVPVEPQDGLVPLQDQQGLAAKYRADLQELRLTVPPAWIEGLPLRLTSGLQADAVLREDLRVRGLLLNYDLFAQRAPGSTSVSGQAEFRLFTPGRGVWNQGLVSRVVHAGGETRHRMVRLDTSWRYDVPEHAVSFVAGDTVTRSLAWTRAIRIAGLQFGRDQGLQPYRVTAPLLSVAGEAALPSTVELFINGVREMGQPVLPGQFKIDAAPAVTGAGAAQVVITDLNGRVRKIDLDFYAAPSMLRSGTWDGSMEAGYPRTGYGVRSFGHASDPVAMATLRYGLSDDLTLEGHAEAGRGLGMAGAGIVSRLPRGLGVAGAALAFSDSGGTFGAQQAWAYQMIRPHFSLTATLLRRNAGFRDAASLVDHSSHQSLGSLSAGTRTLAGHVGFGWARQTSFDGSTGDVLSASLTRELPGRSTLQVAFLRAGGARRSRQLTIAWSLPLDGRGHLAASYSRTDERSLAILDLASGQPAKGNGIAYRVQASANGSSAGAHAQLTGTHPAVQWSAGAMRTGARETAFYAGVDGALLAAGRRMHAFGRVADGFAVVSTSGVPGVPVRLENRPAGVTDEHGTLLLPQLNAYQRNRVSIDTLGLPEDYRADAVETDAVPERGGGVAVGFRLRRVRPLVLTLLDDSGRPLPMGARVEATGTGGTAQRSVVGQDGFVYLEEIPEGAIRLRAQGRFGSCSAAIAPTGTAPGLTTICRSSP